MTYPLAFRQKIFAAKAKYRLTYEQTSQRFEVPIQISFRWQQPIEPCLTRDKPATKINMEALVQDVEFRPDDYQWERTRRLAVSQRSIGY